MAVGETVLVGRVTGVGCERGVAVAPGMLQAESPISRTRTTISKWRFIHSSCTNINPGTIVEQESLRTIYDSSYIMTVTFLVSGGFYEKIISYFGFTNHFHIK
jgi:hypothetical protein